MDNQSALFMNILKIALATLGERLFLLLALVMTFLLFTWAIWKENPLAIVAAGIFALCIFLPVLWKTYPKAPSGGNET